MKGANYDAIRATWVKASAGIPVSDFYDGSDDEYLVGIERFS